MGMCGMCGLCVYAHAHTHAHTRMATPTLTPPPPGMYMWRSEDNLCGQCSPSTMSGGHAQVIVLGGMHLCPLSHLVSPKVFL